MNSKEMSQINANFWFKIGILILAARCSYDGPSSHCEVIRGKSDCRGQRLSK